MIDKLIEGINGKITAALADVPCFAGSKIFGVAEPILRRKEGKDEWIPAIVQNLPDGDDTYPFVDDDIPIGIYHRILLKSYSQTGNSYGDDLSVSANMKLICWGIRDGAIPTPYDAEALIFKASPDLFVKANTRFERQAVFSDEFKGVQFFLPQTVFLFEIKYVLEYNQSVSCIDLSNLCKN